MKKKVITVLTALLCACSITDDDKVANPDIISEPVLPSVDSTIQKNENSQEQHFPSIELISVDTCFAHFDYENPNFGIDSLLAKPVGENAYTIRVLGNTHCPPAEKPDFMDYTYKDSTLIVDIYKLEPSFDVTCTCMFWSNILIKGELKFNTVQMNGFDYRVLIEE